MFIVSTVHIDPITLGSVKLVGVFTSLEKAKNVAKNLFNMLETDVFNIQIEYQEINNLEQKLICVIHKNYTIDDYGWKGLKLDPIIRFAYAVLNEDPIACDAVRDILKM